MNEEFDLGDFVYLTTDPEQCKRVVTAKIERLSGIIYEISFGIETSNHYNFEMSREEDILLKTTN